MIAATLQFKPNRMKKSFVFICNSVLVCAALVCAPVFAAEPSPASKQEVEHLFSYLRNSGCEFFRNGTWYDGKAAVDHLQKKYQYLVDKGMVSSAESFIDKGASESSMSGKPYLVRCGANAKPVESAAWLKAELAKYRKAVH